MGHTTKEAREELSRKELLAIEDCTEEQLIAEGFRKPYAQVFDFSKTLQEKAELSLVKNKKSDFGATWFKCVVDSRPELLPYFRQNGTKFSKREAILRKINRVLNVYNS